MWNQLEVFGELSNEVACRLQDRLNELKRDLTIEPRKEATRTVHNLIEVDDGFLIWNPKKQEINHVLIKNANQVTAIQSLLLNHPPLFDIDSIKLNADHKFLLLSGRRSLSVIEMPSKWSTRLYEAGKNEIMVKSWNLVERYFVCSDKIALLDCHWHPGSVKHNHIVILTNDNHIRVIDIHDPDVALQEIKLGLIEDDCSDVGISIFAQQLGESAVSFDFGPSIIRSNESLPKLNTVDLIDIESVYWPIYVLKGNGDILLVYNSLFNIYVSKKVIGPLKMYPSAEDNYGVDACSLIVIPTNPALIVIGTSTGMLHHCIVLPDNDQNNLASYLPEPNLYVRESIELTLSLTSSMEIDNPLKLIKSQHNFDCYFCIHQSGVHIIKVPFVKQLQENVHNEEPPMNTIVEHLICTRPSASNDPIIYPVGVTLSIRSTFLLFIVLSDGKMYTQRLAPINLELQSNTIPNKLSEDLNSSKSQTLKPIEFNEHVKKLLQGKQNAPLISTKVGNKEPGLKESLQILLNSTQIFRNGYLSKLDAVRELIDVRGKSLQKTYGVQKTDIDQLEARRLKFIQDGERIKNKYESILEKQKTFSQRLSKLVDRALHNYKEPTKTELEQMKKLELINQDVDKYRSKLIEFEQKFSYFHKINQNKSSEASQLIRNSTRTPDWKNIKRVLNQQSEQIDHLVQRINSIKANQQVN